MLQPPPLPWEPRRSGTRRVKIVTTVVFAVLLGATTVIGFGAWWFFGNRQGAVLANNGYAAAFRGDHDEAIRMLTAALQKPLFANQRCYVYLSRGTARNWKSQFQEAIEDFTAALRDNPNLAVAYAGRGYALQRTYQLDKALADLGEAIRLDPNLGYAHHNRAQIFYNRHDFDRALADADEAVRCDPGSADALVLRGLCYLGKNDLDRALASFDGAIALDPKNVSAHEQRSNLYFRKGDWEKSQRDITEASGRRPKASQPPSAVQDSDSQRAQWQFKFSAGSDKLLGTAADSVAIKALVPSTPPVIVRWVSRSIVVVAADCSSDASARDELTCFYVLEKHDSKWKITHHYFHYRYQPSNQSRKPIAPLREQPSVFAPTPCSGLSLSR